MIVHMILGIINPAGVSANKPPSAPLALVARCPPTKWSIRALCCEVIYMYKDAISSLTRTPVTVTTVCFVPIGQT